MSATKRALAVASAAIALSAVPAAAAPLAGPPVVDPAALPANTAPAPPQPMVQRRACVLAGGIPDQALTGTPPDQAALGLPSAQRLTRGEGQTVAVLGTGVARNPRLTHLVGGGDYVGTTDGLDDCDGTGTLVAGIVGGRPAPGDGFTGVAPEAKILSLRVWSAMFNLKEPGDNPTLAQAAEGVQALARAVARAADLGATVIVISSAICVPSDVAIDLAPVGAALRHAVVDKDALVVAAAGDTDQPNCAANPLAGQGWAGAATLSVPSLWQPYVLSAASLTPQGQPSASALAGPWTSVAAPGEAVVSLSNAPDAAIANALLDEKGKPVPVRGSAYAAGYVAGVAALVRSRYPQLTAYQAMSRITRSAHNAARLPSSLVGAGTVDPLAALTWDLPAGDAQAPRAAVKQIAPPVPAPADPTAPKAVALAGAAALVLVVGVVLAVSAWRRKGAAR
ncbi:MAG: type VII secretion-associated serine protease mycosin [Segniliparus sp.]|uniref:type VII secretion-associated serine protease mycosin n=1 Tax=Segniliparus sp. TaxID=2804064 RepID=UPI003F310956